VTGLFGGAFDPPHDGHVRLAEAAIRQFGLARLVVLVAEAPWYKSIPTPLDARLRLAEAAFGDIAEVEHDPYPATVELLEARSWEDPIFLVGADQLAAFDTWREPERVLELTRLGVATRPGTPRALLDEAVARLSRPDRVLFFELDPVDVSSTAVRERVAAGEPIDGLVPPAVAALIRELGLYRSA
jgi:nicotinate-nucleotide adenylyltransferase